MESNENFDETEYLLSSKANKERLESAIKDFTESRDRIVAHLSRELDIDNSSSLEGQEADFSKNMGNKEPTIDYDSKEFINEYFEYLKDCKGDSQKLKPTVITPVSLLNLGFTEEYQKPECGDAGYLYYSLYLCGVALLSTSLDDDDGFYVFMDDNTKIEDYNKLESLVTSLREL